MDVTPEVDNATASIQENAISREDYVAVRGKEADPDTQLNWKSLIV